MILSWHPGLDKFTLTYPSNLPLQNKRVNTLEYIKGMVLNKIKMTLEN